LTGVQGLYLGIDVGTSATRVSLVSEGGARTASASYPTTRTSDSAAEQDPMVWTRRWPPRCAGPALT
jgi:sugar (pentulose or hexulose) kinase